MAQKGDWQEEAAGKLLTALLVVGAAYLLFRAAMRGIFALIMGGNPENGVYVLFYGGAIALALIALMGVLAGSLFWRRARGGGAGNGAPVLRGGLTLGLLAVALAALAIVGAFVTGAFR